MTMNSSGPISLGGATTGQSINLEIGQPATSTVSLNDTIVRTLANIPAINTTITIPTDFYGKAIANSWFMTISTPAMAISQSAPSRMGLSFDNTGNMLIQFANSSSENPIIANISPSGTVNWSNNFTLSGVPSTAYSSSFIAPDASNPSNINVCFSNSGVPTGPGNSRVTIANFNSSTGNLNSMQYIKALYISGIDPNDSFNTVRSYFPMTSNFIVNTGNNRSSSPPTSSRSCTRGIFNPSMTLIQPLDYKALPGIGLEQNFAINKFNYNSPSKTGAIFGGIYNFGDFTASGTVFANVEQTGTINYAFRTSYAYRTGAGGFQPWEWNGVSFNNANIPYNKFVFSNVMWTAYGDGPASSNYVNNFVVRFNKTTGAVEETVTNFATPGSYALVGGLENYQGITSELDDNGNFCRWTQYQPAPGTANIFYNLRYFNTNNPITNTYSTSLSTSNGPVPTTLNLLYYNNIRSYDGYNYIVIAKATAPSAIGILKIKSDGSNLASGLNVTAPNGFNIQLTPISNNTLYSQTNIPMQSISFTPSPHGLQAFPNPSTSITPATLTITQNTI